MQNTLVFEQKCLLCELSILFNILYLWQNWILVLRSGISYVDKLYIHTHLFRYLRVRVDVNQKYITILIYHFFEALPNVK